MRTVTKPTSRGCRRHRSSAGAYHCLTFRRRATSSSAPERAGFITSAAAIGTSVSASMSGRDHRGNHGSGQGLIHPAFDTGHPKERQEYDDDDERGEGDGTGDLRGC